MSSKLLDQFGNPIPRERVRRALGFLERTLREDEAETITGVRTAGPVDPEPSWIGFSPVVQPTWARAGGWHAACPARVLPEGEGTGNGDPGVPPALGFQNGLTG